jgi:hypothetical protein
LNCCIKEEEPSSANTLAILVVARTVFPVVVENRIQSTMSTSEASPPEAAPANKTDELLKVVDDQEQFEMFQSAIAIDDSIGEDDDTTDEEDNKWREVLPPPPTPTKPEEMDEKYETVLSNANTVEVDETGGHGHSQESQEPDFSKYKTNVARRLWEAQETAEKAGVKSSSDMVPLTREFQQYRKKMNTLIKLIDEYSEAQKAMKAKRAQVGS